jgi:hypothetical protein
MVVGVMRIVLGDSLQLKTLPTNSISQEVSAMDRQSKARYFVKETYQATRRDVLRISDAAAIEADKSTKMAKFPFPIEET